MSDSSDSIKNSAKVIVKYVFDNAFNKNLLKRSLSISETKIDEVAKELNFDSTESFFTCLNYLKGKKLVTLSHILDTYGITLTVAGANLANPFLRDDSKPIVKYVFDNAFDKSRVRRSVSIAKTKIDEVAKELNFDSTDNFFTCLYYLKEKKLISWGYNSITDTYYITLMAAAIDFMEKP